MFEAQIPHPRAGPAGGGVASLLAHATAIAAALVATARTATVQRQPPPEPPIYFTPDRPQHRAPPPIGREIPTIAAPGAPRIALRAGAIPPVEIPPPGPAPLDPRWLAAPPSAPGTAAPGADTATATRVFGDRWVEERPELLRHPPVRYPDLLKQAGVEGRVVIEVVVDTAGRIERGSLRVVLSTNPLFDAPAREVVAGSVYRPGRLDGRPVRVRVTVPVVFRVSGRPSMM